MSYIIIKTTCCSKKEANLISSLLIRNKIAACVQISKIESFYSWEEEVKKSKEYLLEIKTKADKYQEIESLIEANNSYKVAQIIAISIKNGSTQYLNWIENNCL